MSEYPDPKATARRLFAAPDASAGLVELAERYASDAPDIVQTLLDAVRPRRAESERICELGFGSGSLLEEMARQFPDSKLYGLDMSPGMAQRAQGLCGDRVEVLVGDMERLPFREASLDTAVTCWTLYFMSDVDGALEEIARCLKPEGRLVATTNAPDHMLEYEQLATAALRSVLGQPPEPAITARFDLDTGEPYMRRHFQHVELRRWRGWMTLPDVGPMLQFWDAWRPSSLAGSDGDLVRAEFERLARDWLRRDGQIRISRHGGAFVGIKGR
jgi:SAM-dependent methyltransferase